MGLKATWNQDVSDFQYTEADSTTLWDGIYVPEGLRVVDYQFGYDETILAAYATAGKKFGLLGTQLGLRAEQAYTSAQLNGSGQLDAEPFKNNYFRVYPSVNLFVETDKENT